VEVTPTSPVVALSLFIEIIYKWLISAAVHRTNPPVTISNLYLVLALNLINTIYKDEVTTNVL